MIIKLTGGVVYDPANNVNGKVLDIYINNNKIVSGKGVTQIDQEIDLRGKVVMAGAIDMHTHVGGGKNNIARILLPEDHRSDPVAATELTRSGTGRALHKNQKKRIKKDKLNN